MARICSFAVDYDGRECRLRWRIPAEAHSVGLRGAEGSFEVYLGDDLGTTDGAKRVADAVRDAGDLLYRHLIDDWRDTDPLF